MSFYKWMKKQKKRDDRVGDLAFDIMRDLSFPEYASRDELEQMFSHFGLDEVFREAWAEYSKKGRARLISPKLRFEILQRDNFRCQLCGATAKEDRLEIDHKIAVSLGGTSEEENLWTLCLTCNRGKGASHFQNSEI